MTPCLSPNLYAVCSSPSTITARYFIIKNNSLLFILVVSQLPARSTNSRHPLDVGRNVEVNREKTVILPWELLRI